MLQSETILSQVSGGLYPPMKQKRNFVPGLSCASNGAFVKHKLNRNEHLDQNLWVELPRSEGSHH